MPATRLAMLRLATGGFALWYLLTRWDMMIRLAGNEVGLFAPVGLAQLLPGPLPQEGFVALLALTVLFNVLYLLGWRFRYTGPAFALLLLATLSYRNSWSMIYHNRNALVLQVLIIGLVAAGDALSVDAWQRARRGQLAPKPAERYGWPIRLLCLGTMLTYLVSGVAKVMGDLAWQWVAGEAMRSQIAVDALRKVLLGETASPLFEWLYPFTWLFMGMGILTMILELGAPLFLVDRRLSVAWALLTWMMHWGIFFLMGIRFRYQMTGIIFLPFFQVERLLDWLTPGRRHAQPSVLANET